MVFFQRSWGWAIGQKFEIFGKINQQSLFDVILERQKVFLDYKKQKFQKVEKSGLFQRGKSMVLVKNLKLFPCFYFWQDQPAKCV